MSYLIPSYYLRLAYDLEVIFLKVHLFQHSFQFNQCVISIYRIDNIELLSSKTTT